VKLSFLTAFSLRYFCLRMDKVSSNSRLVLTRSLTDSTSFAPKAVRDFVATIDGCLCFMSSPKNADTLYPSFPEIV